MRREFENRELDRIAEIDRAGDIVAGRHQPHQAVDQIVDIAERARLRAVAIDRDVVAEQRLHDEIRHHAAVVRVHARAVGVEDARDLDAQLVLAPIVEEQRLGAALAFVVAGARADRIDVAPIVLGLRMDVGVAVDFRGRGLEDLGLHPLGEAQHVDGAVHAGLGRLHRIVLVVDGRSRAGQIVDLVDLDDRAETSRRGGSARNACGRADARCSCRAAREKIVDAKDVGALRQQPLAKMRAEKAGAAGDQNATLQVHELSSRNGQFIPGGAIAH